MTAGFQHRNLLEMQFFGLQRSGNHAVLAWLFKQFDNPVYFLNFVRPFGDPFTTFRAAKLPNSVPVPPKRLRGAALSAEKELARARKLEKLRVAKKEVLAISYENLRLPRLEKRALIASREELLGTSGRIFRFLLLRDFYNWIASRIRQLETLEVNANIDKDISLWIIYAREFLGETAYLGDGMVIKISYPRWASDALYRLDLLNGLGVAAKDNSNAFVPGTGGGSSFDGLGFREKPGEMDIGERWRYLFHEKFEDVRSIIRRRKAEIDQFNGRIFEVTSPL